MSILDVTEDQIFQTLGRGRDPNFKPIEKARPVISKPKKTCSANHVAKPGQQQAKPQTAQAVKVVLKPDMIEPERSIPLPEVDEPVDNEPVKKLVEELCELNNRVDGIQATVKWYIMPQFAVILILLLALFIRS
ncbi:hypothetical protein ANME2D_01491 [Candidatus Methanoperedens nitroreducens]|uniref:Uncharacterized protein n=1 Tax=Candidatus Methanoperedens nitratireducens TaxID=1392998 RepID=A0A062V8K6_9EURY|nr:hypothetical protein [Candidatus Methanoperedens nitroreducens]KCZ72089.1 hypothetical protein ANME2D_01491 [Candidatus Methanoperedens nitroreducens]MDJ1421932.1 hypothetical protein [Candidatus Methanoperedens sp.]